MQKKGQITIFILLALAILIGISLFFFIDREDSIKQPQVQQASEFSVNLQSISNFVENCMLLVGEEGVDYISRQGGYYKTPLPSTFALGTLQYEIPFYYDKGEYLVPSLSQIESEISNYVKDNLNFCLKDFQVLREQGYEIEWEMTNVSVNIVENEVLLEINFPITVKVSDAQNTFSDFAVRIDRKLRTMYEIADGLVKMQPDEPNAFLIGELVDLTFFENVTFDIENDEDDVIITLIDDVPSTDNDHYTKEIEENHYIFNFASRYDWEFPQDNIELEDVPDLTTSAGYLFSLQLSASKSGQFFDSTDLFDVDPITGMVEFIPEDSQTGKHPILVGVRDAQGNSATKTFEINIIEGNEKPYIEQIPDQTTLLGKPFILKIQATDPENHTILFSDETDLFDILPFGVIDFVPNQTGNFPVTIIAVDIQGAFDKETFYLEVKNE
ncbi:hypothetical protein CMO93_03610 [Candidatus Woesearchaeota archaeon]|nr:hypothetical protein [Candidatus Woesearchaeota archaeon]|tara:strand:+ start:129 stop:1454 length:1326 start_codon:yes stop_codon:yes gene_type:complete